MAQGKVNKLCTDLDKIFTADKHWINLEAYIRPEDKLSRTEQISDSLTRPY